MAISTASDAPTQPFRVVALTTEFEYRTLFLPRVRATRRGCGFLYAEIMTEACEIGAQFRVSAERLREAFSRKHLRSAFRIRYMP